MAKSIIPKFQLNLDIPEYDSFGDSSFSADTEQFLKGTSGQRDVMAKGLGDFSKIKDLPYGINLDPAAGNEAAGTTMFKTNFGGFTRYTGEKLGEGIAWLTSGMADLPNVASRSLNTLVGFAVNPIIEAFGGKASDFNKSISEMTTGAVKELGNMVGVKVGFDTSKWKDGVLKDVVNDAQNGKSIIAEMIRRSQKGFESTSATNIEELRTRSDKWADAAEVAGSIAYTAPIMLDMYFTGGIGTAAANYSQRLDASMDEAKATGGDMAKAMSKGIMQANIDTFTEMIFGMFGESTALVNGSVKAMEKLGLKALGEKMGEKTIGKVIMTIFGFAGSAGEEGLEEAIAYPFYQYVDWKYAPENSDKTFGDFLASSSISGKDWLRNAYMGAIAGAFFGAVQLPGSIRSDIREGQARKMAADLTAALDLEINAENLEATVGPVIEQVADIYNDDRRKNGYFPVNRVFQVYNKSGPAVLNQNPRGPTAEEVAQVSQAVKTAPVVDANPVADINTAGDEEGINLVAWVKDPDTNKTIRIERDYYKSKADFKAELRANGYKVQHVYDEADLKIQGSVDNVRNVAEMKKNIKIYKDINESGVFDNTIKGMEDLLAEATGKPTAENVKKANQIKADSKQYAKNMNDYPTTDAEMRGKMIKGNAMAAAAEIRKTLQGDSLTPVEGGLTTKELAAAVKREASNYIGKLVTVDGKPAKVFGNSFGKVTVQFEDGSKKTVESGMIKARETTEVTTNESKQEAPAEAVKPAGKGRGGKTVSNARKDQGAAAGEGLQSGVRQEPSGDVGIIHKPTSDSKVFAAAIKLATDTNTHGAFVEAKSAEEYSKPGYKLYISESGTSGFAITPEGDLVSLFRQDKSPDKKVLHSSILIGVEQRAKTCDFFDGYLPEHYTQYGFVPVARIKWNDEYAPDKWNYERDGRPDVIFMVHNGDSYADVKKKFGTYPDYNPATVPYVEEYDQGKALQRGEKVEIAPPVLDATPSIVLAEGESKHTKGMLLNLVNKATPGQAQILGNLGFNKLPSGQWFIPKNRFHLDEFQEAMKEYDAGALIDYSEAGVKEKMASDMAKELGKNIEKDADPFATPDSEMDPIYVEGILANGFIPQRSTTAATDTGYVGERSEDVKKRMEDAAFPKRDKEGVTDQVKQALKEFSLGETQIDYQYGDVRESIVDLQKVNGRAGMLVKLYLDKAYAKLSDAEYTLATKFALYSDLAFEVKRGMFKKIPLPFNIPSEAYVLQAYEDAKAALELPQNARVRAAIAVRKKTFKNLRDVLVAKASKVNMDLSLLYSKPDYFAHVIHEYLDKGSAANMGKVKYHKREGSELDYVTDLELNDLIVIKKLLRDTAYVDVILKLKKLDQKKAMTNDDGELVLQDGYSLVTTSELGVDYRSTAEIQKNMDKVLKDVKKRRAQIDSDYAHARNQANSNAELKTAEKEYKTRITRLGMYEEKALTRAQFKAAGESFVIPTDVATAVKAEFRQAKQADAESKVYQKVTGVWKQIVTHAPNKILKYAFRNALGDAEAIFLAEPKAFMQLNNALRELVQLQKAGQASERLTEYIRHNGMTTGLSEFDMEGLKGFERLRFSRPQGGKGAVIDAVSNATRKYFKTAQGFTEFREQLFRYATYLHYDNMIAADIKKGGKGLPSYYGAAIPAEIKSISDPHRRAFVLSNKLVGDYHNISRMGQKISKTVWPFYRFFEMNMRRNFRIMMNAFYSDPDIVESQGKQVAARLAKTGKFVGVKLGKTAIINLGRLAIGYGILKGLEELWNNVLFGETERNLPENIRNRSHFNMGMINGKAMYLGGVSVIEQFWQSLGMTSDIPVLGDAYEVITGKKTFMDKAESIAINTTASYINGLSPFVKLPIELTSGNSLYTAEGSDARPIRDRWQHIATQVGLGDLYNAVAGRPQPGGSPLGVLSNFASSAVYQGEAALWDVYEMKDEYLGSIGKTSGTGGGGNQKMKDAFYYYKLALKLGDNGAAERYLGEYMMNGGTMKTYKSSMDNMDPLSSLEKRERADMLRQMNEEDKARYAEAIKYIEFIKSEGNAIPKP